jgi:hypothetical protein
MPTFDELDKRSTKDLRARAFRVARHRLDIGFFWRLVEYAPWRRPAADTLGTPRRMSPASPPPWRTRSVLYRRSEQAIERETAWIRRGFESEGPEQSRREAESTA